MAFTSAKFFRAILCLGLAAPVMLAAISANAAGQFNTVYAFAGQADGATPGSSVTPDIMGDLYGVAVNGGLICSNTTEASLGCGTVYRIDGAGNATTVFSFTGKTGYFPSTKLALIGNALYGGTEYGGKTNNGVLFGVHTDGTGYKVLHNFDGTDGSFPVSQLVPVGDGSGFYGVTQSGGPGHNAQGNAPEGVLFELQRGGRFTILHAFNGKDGAMPTSILKGQDGTLYGTTYQGGTGCSSRNGCGTVFSYVPSTNTFTSLYQFTGKQDGELPFLGSVDTKGVLYGATEFGTVFQLTPTGGVYVLNTLVRFNYYDGGNLNSGPTLLPNGSLIGATTGNGSYGGVLYLLNPTHFPKMEILHTFSPGSPTMNAEVADTQPELGRHGLIYGTTNTGGPTACHAENGKEFSEGCGTIYSYGPDAGSQ